MPRRHPWAESFTTARAASRRLTQAEGCVATRGFSGACANRCRFHVEMRNDLAWNTRRINMSVSVQENPGRRMKYLLNPERCLWVIWSCIAFYAILMTRLVPRFWVEGTDHQQFVEVMSSVAPMIRGIRDVSDHTGFWAFFYAGFWALVLPLPIVGVASSFYFSQEARRRMRGKPWLSFLIVMAAIWSLDAMALLLPQVAGTSGSVPWINETSGNLFVLLFTVVAVASCFYAAGLFVGALRIRLTSNQAL